MSEQPSIKASNRVFWNRLFSLWIVVGFLFVVMSVVGGYKCPSITPAERTFQIIEKDPKLRSEKQAQYDEYDRWVAWLTFLAHGTLVYGSLGVLSFFRRGCVVFIIVVSVVVICEFVLLDATWVPL
jgi:hypothetical protein